MLYFANVTLLYGKDTYFCDEKDNFAVELLKNVCKST